MKNLMKLRYTKAWKRRLSIFCVEILRFLQAKRPRISFMAVAKNLKAFSALVSLRFIRFLTCLSFMRLP
ncbi:MAG: hypothetical protein K5786_04365 [Treponema sp.]|nr:hypothetical protein [Treponema sp.]